MKTTWDAEIVHAFYGSYNYLHKLKKKNHIFFIHYYMNDHVRCQTGELVYNYCSKSEENINSASLHICDALQQKVP